MLPLHGRSFRRPEVAAILGVTDPVVAHLERIALDPGADGKRCRLPGEAEKEAERHAERRPQNAIL
ncbi:MULTISPECIES: hypothetical protein [unclassified Chelatococcus]|uniref:hypothetical protein n=1 Tax=unclassified Chelatococcus TaxID=2638111 RepID=UPI001BD19B16|nr:MULTISPECIES: hypothetical protein [unclassified Chelatococcus]CAH1662704.1 hypothetical protein CHELA41_22255 [Hyphomicrobiales bacterium]MBS7741416.1 hypothetical protein [Chelatococcus sp. HY11]MBX3546102.1 hypothetical protein [Chelatococcus sp.]MCO5077250.1 hypothetical protein [Chelatococcus sp.]CAH1682571.1 hypothetical protein CHELA20_52671 [Hyphomicrobiales bacterium]